MRLHVLKNNILQKKKKIKYGSLKEPAIKE